MGLTSALEPLEAVARPSYRRARPERRTRRTSLEGIRFAGFIGAIVAAFALGGSSRSDMGSMMLLVPLFALALPVAIVLVDREAARANRMIVVYFAVTTALVAAHLVSLPPSLWTALPGRELIAAIDAEAGLEGLWRPLSMDPQATWRALLSLVVPLAVLAFALGQSSQRMAQATLVLLGVGLAGAILALLQVAGDPEGPLYLYRLTNNGAAVGLFANRNHHAVFLAALVPLLAAYVSHALADRDISTARARSVAGLGAGVAVIFAGSVVLAGSRAGLVCLVLALPLGLLVLGPRAAGAAFARSRGSRSRSSKASLPLARLAMLALALPLVALLGLAGLRGEATQRLVETGFTDELRFQITPTVAKLALDYAPMGTGIGSFETAFKSAEPPEFLGPQYINHAHNDWLEIAMTAGLPGVVLLSFALGWLGLTAWRLARMRGDASTRRPFRLAAASGLFLLACASLADYPLRTPALQAFAVVLIVWLAASIQSRHGLARSMNGASRSHRPNTYPTTNEA
ncbi:MAG: O-antigen ligase family protein [Erythrobacter sp.]|jgi:O-antigen ligase|nr:O-antigen ligase family protein [Erythrobacter sp.]